MGKGFWVQKRCSSLLQVLGGVFLVAGLSATETRADLTFCNESGTPRSIAIGYSADGAWTSEGWWNIDAGACATVIKGNLKQQFYYYRATGRDAEFQGEGYMFCTDRQPFTIVGDERCEERGFRRESFAKIDTGPTAKTYTFTLAADAAAPAATPSRPQGGQGPGPRQTAAAPPPAAPPARQQGGPGPGSRQTATSAIPEPGTYGEPLAIYGIFRGCASLNDTEGCTFLAEDWRYVVSKDERTPPQVFAAIEGLGLFDRVAVEGDLVAQGDVSVDITVRHVEVSPDDEQAFPTIRNALVGGWQSAEDPDSVIRFTDGGQSFTYLQGELVEEATYEVVNGCPGEAGQPDTAYLVTAAGPTRIPTATSSMGFLSIASRLSMFPAATRSSTPGPIDLRPAGSSVTIPCRTGRDERPGRCRFG